jgi:hypothetical protein
VGTVTSVALLDGSTTPIYAISGSPITSAGTLTFTLDTQPANYGFFGPVSGSAIQPTFRAMVPADLATITLTGDVTGSASGGTISTTVTALQGHSVSTTAPTDAQILIWNSGTSKWTPESISGDVSLTDTGVTSISSSTVTGKLLTGYTTGTNTPIIATNTILQAFENLQAQVSTISGSAITSLTGDVTATGPGAATATVVAIQGHSVSNTAPTDAQILIWNSGTSKWTPESISGDATIADTGFITLSTTAVTGKLLTGYTTGTNTPITATNSILTAFENLQAQVSATVGAAITSLTGDVTATGPGAATATVVAIQGHSISTTAPTDAQILIWNSGTSKWTPESVSGDINITDLGAATIQTNVVSNSKLAQAPTLTLKGNNTGTTANVTDLTVPQVNTMLGTVTVIGTYDANGSVANGLSISGNDLYAQSATTSNPGMVNTTTQSFSGNKTFTGTVAITPSSISALTIDTTAFVFDSTNDALGIGLQPSTAVMIDGINTTGSSKLVQMTGYGVGSTTGYRGRFARGTVSSPSAVQSGDILSAISGRGYGTSQFATASTGVINIVAGETFTNTSNLTYLQFSTTPTGSVTSAEAMRVASTGVTLGPQSSSTAIHQINGGEQLTTNTIAASTYTVDSVTTDYIIYTNSTSNTITITLPTPTNGRLLIIQDKAGTNGTNNVTINPHASEKINGASSFVMSQNYGSMRITSDGTNWFVQNISPNVASTIQPVVALTESGGATTINWATGNVFTLTLNANLTISFSNQTAGQTIVIRLTNTASNYTVTWPTIKWPVQTTPVMTTGAFSDIYTLIYDGSNTYGSYVQNF